MAANEEIMAGIEELSVTNIKLRSINADLDNFVYTASHDLKSPISNIEGLVHLLNKKLTKFGWEDETTKKIISMIGDSENRFKETILDLTEITKIGLESSNQSINVNILEVINEVKVDLHISILESNALISINVDKDAHVLFSKKNLKSIVYNLLSNAIKYKALDKPPVINIYWNEENNYKVLYVQDNGLGLGTHDKTKIFGLYKRLHSHVEGTGIGLYIVKKIMDNAEGKIEVESTIRLGSTYKIYFKN
ncbi:MAG: ATP-binding protein [Bacteroidota bacterium]|nr:ATP-binding protein [Bacteroidota bacterium]